MLHKASGAVPGVSCAPPVLCFRRDCNLEEGVVGARARPCQEVNESELSKSARIAGAAATAGSTAGTIELHEVNESEFSEVARIGESVGIIGLCQVMESDVARPSLIHESSLARSCADVGAFGAVDSVSGSAVPCVAALPADRALTYARVAANACGEVASACNSGSLDTVNLLRVQHELQPPRGSATKLHGWE